MSINIDISGTDIDIHVEQVGESDYKITVSTGDGEESLYLGRFETYALAMKILQVMANE